MYLTIYMSDHYIRDAFQRKLMKVLTIPQGYLHTNPFSQTVTWFIMVYCWVNIIIMLVLLPLDEHHVTGHLEIIMIVLGTGVLQQHICTTLHIEVRWYLLCN